MINKCKVCSQPLVRERTVCDKHIKFEDWGLVERRIKGKELLCDSAQPAANAQPGQQ